MTKNVTMALDEDLIKKMRKIAVDKNTTMTALIRSYISQLVEQEDNSKHELVSELAALLEHSPGVIGEKTWTRDDLHER